MLVLSRERDEEIIIGDGIKVRVLDIRNGKVRLGITAPADVPVHRLEVWEAIEREKARGSETQKGGNS
jgi:carbon storage regulator